MLNTRKLDRKIGTAKPNLPNDNVNFHYRTRGLFSSKDTGSNDSKWNRAKQSFATFSSGVYSYHANPSQRFNMTMDTTTNAATELRIEASFWVSIIFVVFLFSVITVYFVLIQKGYKIGSEDNWMDTCVNSENNQIYPSHSKAIPIVGNESNDSTLTFKGIPNDVKTCTNEKSRTTQNHSLSVDPCTTTSFKKSDTICETERTIKRVSKYCFNGAVIYTQNEKKKYKSTWLHIYRNISMERTQTQVIVPGLLPGCTASKREILHCKPLS